MKIWFNDVEDYYECKHRVEAYSIIYTHDNIKLVYFNNNRNIKSIFKIKQEINK